MSGFARLDLSLQDGAPFAAYLWLAPHGPKPVRQWQPTGGLDVIVDFDAWGRALGVEILAFDETTLAAVERALAQLGRADASGALAPLWESCAAPPSRAA